MPDDITMEQPDLDLETGETGETPEPREPIKVAGLTEDEVKAKLERLSEVETKSAQQQAYLERMAANEKWQQIQREEAEALAREQAEIEHYQTKLQRINELVEQARATPGPAGERKMVQAIKLQRELQTEPVKQEVQQLMQFIPQMVQQQVLEMLKPNLLGQFVQTSVGDDVQGIGTKTAQFRNLMASGQVDDNTLAEFVKDIVTTARGAKQQQAAGNVHPIRGGMGMEGIDDARSASDEGDFDKALRARRARQAKQYGLRG